MARNDVAPKAFLDIETALIVSLLRDWQPAASRLYKSIVEDVSKSDYPAALDKIGRIDFTPVIVKRIKAFETFGMAAVLFGAKRARADQNKTTFETVGTIPEMLTFSTQIMGMTLNDSFRDLHKRRASNLVNQWASIEQGGQWQIEKAEPKLKPNSIAPDILHLDDPVIDFGTAFADQFMDLMRKS
jgi:hypothetical protein